MANSSTSVISLYALNDLLTDELEAWGWTAENEADYDALNNLTHDVYGLIQSFIERAREG